MKLSYAKPVLREHGSVETITAGGPTVIYDINNGNGFFGNFGTIQVTGSTCPKGTPIGVTCS